MTPKMLEDSAVKFLQACIKAGWEAHMHTKHHWLIHFGYHLQVFQESGLGPMLPNCFVNERKHKLARRYGGDIANTRTFERSVTTELLCHDMACLEKPDLFASGVHLDKKCKAPKKVQSFLQDTLGLLAKECYTNVKAHLASGGACQKEDVIIMKDGSDLVPAQVWLHAYFDGNVISLVSQWEMESLQLQDGFATCKEKEDIRIVPTSSILCAVPYCPLGQGLYRLLVPLQFRC